MSNRVVAVAAAFLMSASVSAAQTPSAFAISGTQVCAPTQNDNLKKREELVKVQAKIWNLIGAVDELRNGITYQQQVESLGKLQAVMAGTFSAARVTKAMSDTVLNIAQPIAPHVKKAYDAADAGVAAYFALSDGKGMQASAKGLSAVQSAGEANDQYLKSQKGMVIRPGKMKTPGVVSSAVKITDDLRRGDYAGAASNVATVYGGSLDQKAKQTKSFVRGVSSGLSMVSDTPGKTDDSRVADLLNAGAEGFKAGANAAQGRGAYSVAAMAGRSARLLGYSGMMLEQVSNAKQGLADTAAMVEIYNGIDQRSTGTQKKMQKRIDSKLEEIGRLRKKESDLQVAISQSAASAQDCRRPAAGQLAGTRTAQPPAVRSPYTWDRAANRERLQRAQQLRDAAEARRTVQTVPMAPGSPSGPVYGIWDTPPQPASVTNSQRQPSPAPQTYSGEGRRCSDPPCGVQ
jgi:hypothetical protein